MEKNTTKKTATKKQPFSKKETDEGLLEFFTGELKDIYWAEKHLVR